MTKRQTRAETLAFKSLRNDWYALNSVMPRAVRGTMTGRRPFVFTGFPRQWLPVFVWYGVPWRRTVAPGEHIPFISGMTESDLKCHIQRAYAAGTLRTMVESISVYDPVIADFLFIVDHTLVPDGKTIEAERSEIARGRHHRRRPLLLNSWQAYGRPALRALADRAMSIHAPHDIAVVLPCALTRPYDQSKTHRRLYALLQRGGHSLDTVHRIVLTSLGILPEELWSEPEVLAYDAGVPDVYRTLTLARTYFRKHSYSLVLDCCQYAPYSDVLRIVAQDGFISRLEKVAVPQRRMFFVRA